MNEEYNESEQLSSKGFYIALLLCICVIAVSAWVILSVRNDREQAQADDMTLVDQQPVIQQQPVYDVDVRLENDKTDDVLSPVQPDAVETLSTPEPAEMSNVQNEPDMTATMNVSGNENETGAATAEPVNSGVYVWPVVGTIEAPYSMDALAYNVTLSDWRTHDGIDIGADAGSNVLAAAGGIVEDVFADDLYGTTVVINHGDGLKSYYANLQEVPTVNVGDQVTAGQVIGAVGRTALCETAETYHLHLAMSLNDQSVDPADYLPKL